MNNGRCILGFEMFLYLYNAATRHRDDFVAPATIVWPCLKESIFDCLRICEGVDLHHPTEVSIVGQMLH